jgi:uncharacterized protein YciI
MTDTDAMTYEWLDDWIWDQLDGSLTLVVAQAASPEEFLTAAGAAPDGQVVTGVAEVVNGATGSEGPHGWTLTSVLTGATTVAPGWVLGAEVQADPARLAALSASGTLVMFGSTVNADDRFDWWEHGVQVAEAELSGTDHLYGSDPGRLTAVLAEAGLGPAGTGRAAAAAAAVIERITGVVITEEILETGKFTVGKVALA